MIEEGLIDEVKHLMNIGLSDSDISMKGIGYKEVIDFLNGKVSLDEAVEKIKRNTRNLAKRQITWFKRYDDMKWIEISGLSKEDVVEEIICLLQKK